MSLFILPFNATEIPVKKIFEIENTDYYYTIQYNEYGQHYTLTISDENDNILYTTKLVYAGNALHAIEAELGFTTKVFPYNFLNETKRVTKDNFGSTVKLYAFQSV